MSDNLDIKVPIRENLKKALVFDIQARLPIGIVLRFAGFKNEMVPMLQSISHVTRAYIINADGLNGFLIGIVGCGY